MPDPRDLTTGSSSLVLGCDSYTSPAELGDTEMIMGQNVVVRGGIVQTRPGSRSLFCLPDGNFQGCTLFTPANGVAHLVFAVNGKVYVSAAPFTSYRRLWNLQFSLTSQYMAWAICLKSTDYDNEGNLIFLDNPYSILVMQDGLTRAAYWDGSTSAHINPSPAPDNTDVAVAGYQGTPVGLWMIWSGNRLWVSRGNQIYASDIGNPLKFTEAQYINEGRAFYLTGPCTGMIEVPSGTGEDKGFIAFTENDGTLFQSYIQNRTDWLATPLFQNTILPNVGCVAPRSLITQYGLNWWFSARGLTNLNAAFRQNLSSRIDYQDNQMMASKAYLSPNLSGVCGSFFENYLFMSVPSADVLNRHTWVLDQAPMEGNVNAWAGFWTGWRPIEWCRGIVNGDERVFFGSIDYDGKNRIWEGMLAEKRDNGCAITCYAQLRDHAFGSLDLKKYDWSKFFLSQILGDVYLNVYVASTKGAYQLQKEYKIVATEGQIYMDQQYSESGTLMIGNRVQSRTIRTPSGQDDNECNSCGVESKQGNKIDYAFTHLLVWSGIMGVRAYQIHAHEEPDRNEGDCEEPETGPRVLNAQGCSGLELFVDGEVFPTYTGVAEGTARLNNGTLAYIRQERVSAVSQADADAKAHCAVLQAENKYEGADVTDGVYNLGSAQVGEGSYMIVDGAVPDNNFCSDVVVTIQPSGAETTDGASASFSVLVSGESLSYRWQISTNGGVSWSNLTDDSTYSGSTTNSLSVDPAYVEMNGYLYRCAITRAGCDTVFTDSAMLTVAESPSLIQWMGYVDANGGGYEADSISVARQLLRQISATGFSGKIKYLLPFLGAGIGAARAPLIDVLSAGSAVNTNFVDGDFSQSTGLQGDGTTKTMNTNLLFTQLGTSNQAGFGWWENNISFGANVHPIGCYGLGSFGQQRFILDLRAGTRNSTYGTSGPNTFGESVGAINAHYYAQRNSGPVRKLFLSGAQIGLSNTSAGGESGIGDQTIRVCGSINESSGLDAWPGRGAVAYLTDGTLADGEVATLHQLLIDYLFTPIGRPYA